MPHSPRTRCFRAVSLLSAVALGACVAGDTVVNVTVEARSMVPDPAKLGARLWAGSQATVIPAISDSPHILEPLAGRTLFPPDGDRITLFSIIANGRRGPTTVEVQGLDETEAITSFGAGTTTIVPDEQREAAVILDPADFAIRSSIQPDAKFDQKSAGRQIAADNRGNSVVVWESCPLAGSCNVWIRLLDANSNLVGNEIAIGGGGGGDSDDMPAVGIDRDDSTFIVAWRRGGSSPGIYAQPYQIVAGGSAIAGSAVRLSPPDASPTSTPDVTALGGSDSNQFLVAWTQTRNGSAQVAGLVLDKDANVVGSPLVLANATSQLYQKCAVAAGIDGGFIVAWIAAQNDRRNVEASVYRSRTEPVREAFRVAGKATDQVSALDVTGRTGGFAVVWDDINAASDDPDGQSIRLARLDDRGQRVSEHAELVLNTTNEGDQHDPTVASSPNGALLVIWTSETANDEDDRTELREAGGLRARLLDAGALPIASDEFALTTTRDGRQELASVASVDSDSFALSFLQSDEVNDVLGQGIYARRFFTATGAIPSLR